MPGDLRNEKLPAGLSVMSVTRWRTCINNYCIVYETDRWGKDDSLSGRSSGQWPADNKLAYSQILLKQFLFVMGDGWMWMGSLTGLVVTDIFPVIVLSRICNLIYGQE